MLGGFAEIDGRASRISRSSSPTRLDFAQGAGLILNYHTAYFALRTRGRLIEGETVLVHGAAGGVGTASIQVAKGLGARTIAVVSSDEKEQVARAAGADEVLRSDGAVEGRGRRRSAAPTSCSTRSAATASPTACARSTPTGGVVVVGFTGGSIPEVRVNRLLLNNIDVVGAGWGAYIGKRPEVDRGDRGGARRR